MILFMEKTTFLDQNPLRYKGWMGMKAGIILLIS